MEFLQNIAKEIKLKNLPKDITGIPTANPQRVWLFPFKFERNHNEINRLWEFFFKAMNNNITDDLFADILKIRNVGKTKITEALFYVDPERFFPLDEPTRSYLKDILKINPDYKSYSDYRDILKQIKEKTNKEFYELSDEAWQWFNKGKNINYWVFQGSPKIYNIIDSITDNALETWTVNSFKDEIQEGDNVILWVTGNKAGCYALCEVVSEVYEGLDDEDQIKYYTDKSENKSLSRVRIRIIHNLSKQPILKSEIDTINELSKLKVGNQGTNFRATKEEYLKLLEMAEQRNQKKYWLYAPGENAKYWEEFYSKGIMGLGWDNLGDLNNYKTKDELVLKLREIENTSGSKVNDTLANYEFKEVLSKGDIIIVKKGQNELVGYGEVVSDYYYDNNRTTYQKCREVDWKKKGHWKTDFNLAVKTLTDITKYTSEKPGYKFYYESLLGLMDKTVEDKMKFALNTIFYGPPGTGKTYQTIRRAAEIVENRTILDYIEAKEIFNKHLGGRIEFITFHQNYSYEEFIQGLRPDVENEGSLRFERKDGVFKRIVDKALQNIKDSYVIIIDEINRANISRVFGELITLIEEDKRSEGSISLKCTLPSGNEFVVPSNLYIIGTMNTSDKSIALIDIALRRRFEFEAMYPLYEIVGYKINDVEILKKINKKIIEKKGYDFQIGHSYFMGDDYDLVERMNKKVIPLLLEYFMNDEKEVKDILVYAGLEIEKDLWPLRIKGLI